ncbi:arsenic resistance protein [Corynebacterium lowii]|uniref:Sodium Bile acid symporter family protein n=1 Tax=Corynebacterium lowii TaxID=1544413 RepID=A0A0Q0UCR5_9CORY|nr:bile acid:sodium symporter [Corynebacterium lowii]KQB85715.1 Sodium Bile acid symporter family protein [Corynebacterium lowii]MDP9851016.1 ACR3 family arsenite efflux pump ArsB [Corynebacterium lowii]
MARIVPWLDRHQIPLYLLALGVGAAVGLIVPVSEAWIDPLLMALIYATFLGLPLASPSSTLGSSLRDTRFLAALLVLNFVLVPAVVYLLTRPIAQNHTLLIGVLLVLLAPCVDYVIVFSGLAGGAKEKLLAATPLLMGLQMLLLPVYLRFFAPAASEVFQLSPFIRAFLLLIALPFAAAALTQRLPIAQRAQHTAESSMVPLMMLTLAVVVASQIPAVRHDLPLAAIPIYVAFLLIMAPIGALTAKVFHQDVPATRALVFSGATRNSLVVLPLALTVPGAAAVVVTQTLVELLGMVVYVRLLPRFIR